MQRQQVPQSVIQDLNAQKVEIELELNKLKVVRDMAEMEVVGMASKATSLREDILELEKYVKEIADFSEEYTKEVRQTIVSWQGVVEEARNIATEGTCFLKGIAEEVGSARKELSDFENELKDAHERNVRELEGINAKRKDLDIYKRRMEKRYPNEKFII